MFSNGIISLNGARVRSDMPGLFQVYDTEVQADVIQLMAPQIDVTSRHSRAFKVADSSLVDERGTDNPVDPVNYNAAARLGQQGFETFDIYVLRYAFGKCIITESDQTEANAFQANLESVWMDKYVPQAWQVVAREIGAILADTANYAATLQSVSLDISVETADLQGAVLAAFRAFRALGINPMPGELHAFFNDVMGDLMLNLNQVQQGYGIAGIPSGGSQARIGIADYADLDRFFGKLGVVSHCLTTRTIRSDGQVLPVLDNDLYLLFTGGGQRRSFLKRGVNASAFGGPGVPISFPSYDPLGIGIYMNGEWGIAITSEKLGFIFVDIDGE